MMKISNYLLYAHLYLLDEEQLSLVVLSIYLFILYRDQRPVLRLGWLGVTAPGAGARLLTTSVPGLEEVARFRVPIYIPVSVSSPPTMQCTNNKQ